MKSVYDPILKRISIVELEDSDIRRDFFDNHISCLNLYDFKVKRVYFQEADEVYYVGQFGMKEFKNRDREVLGIIYSLENGIERYYLHALI